MIIASYTTRKNGAVVDLDIEPTASDSEIELAISEWQLKVKADKSYPPLLSSLQVRAFFASLAQTS